MKNRLKFKKAGTSQQYNTPAKRYEFPVDFKQSGEEDYRTIHEGKVLRVHRFMGFPVMSLYAEDDNLLGRKPLPEIFKKENGYTIFVNQKTFE